MDGIFKFSDVSRLSVIDPKGKIFKNYLAMLEFGGAAIVFCVAKGFC